MKKMNIFLKKKINKKINKVQFKPFKPLVIIL